MNYSVLTGRPSARSMSEIHIEVKDGVGFGGGPICALQIVFIVLKLCGVIDWPWLWVLSPLWISAALFASIIMIAISFICIYFGFRWLGEPAEPRRYR